MSTNTDSNLATVPTDSDELASEASLSASSGSFESYLQTRRAQLQKKGSYEVPVAGYENLVGTYHPLSLKAQLEIGERHEHLDTYNKALFMSADQLVNACDGLYGKTEEGVRVDLGSWNVALAKKFGVDGEITTARQAVLAIFKGNEDLLIEHAGEVAQGAKPADAKADEELAEDLDETTVI